MHDRRMQDRIVPQEFWKESLLRRMLWLFPFSFALDFRGNAGGTLAQLVMALIAFFIFGWILLFGRVRAVRTVRNMLLGSAMIVLMGFSTAIYYNVELALSIRAAFPIILFIVGVCAGSIASNSLASGLMLFRGMITAGCVSLAFRFYYSTMVGQIGLDEMRYQVLTPVLSSLIAYVCIAFSYSRKPNIVALLVSAAVIVIAALSVTRAYVITFLFVLIGLPLLYFRLGLNNPQHAVFIRWRKMGVTLGVCGAIIGLAVAAWLRPAVFETWTERLVTARVLTRSGDDINWITRVAEAKGIWRTVSEGPWSLVFGKGFGNSYEWAYEYVEEAQSVSYEMVYAFWAPNWVPGHSPFTYALFFGGLLGAFWQVYAFLGPLLTGWGHLRRLRNQVDDRVLRWFTFNFLSLFLYLSQSFTSNPFGERLSGLYVGLSVGVILSFQKFAPISSNPGTI